jgi:peptidoglycan/LPS O-acetylase OafA/YrhL
MARTTQLSRVVSGLTAVLALIHLVAVTGDDDVPLYALVIVLVTCLVSSVAAVVLLRDNGFAPRMAVLAAAALSVGGTVLVSTVGLPGQQPSGFGALEAAIVALGLAIAALLLVDAHRHPRSQTAASPYAL